MSDKDIMDTSELMDKIQSLPSSAREEVDDFVEFISFKYMKVTSKGKKTRTKGFKFDWAGGLKEYKNQYTSVELQKKALEWRSI